MRHNNHILTLLACIAISLLAVLTSSCDKVSTVDKTLWTGKMRVDWKEIKSFEANLFDSINVGDEIVIGIDYVGDDPWPIVALFDHTHNGMKGAGRQSINESTTEVSYFVSPEMKDIIRSHGITVAGAGFYVTSIGLRYHKTPPYDKNLLWIGDTQLSDWQQFQDFTDVTFDSLHIGDILHFTFSNVKDTAELMFHTGTWGALPEANALLYGDSVYEYIVCKEALNLLKRNGLKVSGVGFTVNRLDVRKPLWEGNRSINWYDGEAVTLPSELFQNVEIGDKIVACFDYTGGNRWPQVTFMYAKNWTDLPSTARTLIHENDDNLSFYVTSDLLEALKNNNIVCSGFGFNIRAIGVVHCPAEKDANTAFWIGNKTMNAEWTIIQRFERTDLADIAPGDIIRFTISRVQKGAQISLRPGDWTEFPNIHPYQLDRNADHYDFPLNDEMVRKIKEVGCLVHGTGYTLDAAHLIKNNH